MPRDEDYFTETEAQSKLRKRVRVKQSGSGYTAGQTGTVHETGYDQEAEGYTSSCIGRTATPPPSTTAPDMKTT